MARSDGEWWLTDVGSTNGTWLNGVQIAKLVEYKAGGSFDAIDGYEYDGSEDEEGAGQTFGELPDGEDMHNF